MEIKVLLDKENNVFLNKTFELTDAYIDDNGNLVLKGQDIEIKFTPYDSARLGLLINQILTKFNLNLFSLLLDSRGEKDESNSPTKQ